MQVTFKTLKQTSFKLECNEDETVASVKAKIETEKGDEFPANSQKLIHSGKIMEDTKQLKDYKVSEKGFIVVMVTTKGKVGNETPAATTVTPEKETPPEVKPVEPTPAAETESAKSQEKTSNEPSKEETSKETTEVPAAAPAAAPTDLSATPLANPATTATEVATDDFGNALLTGSDFEACVERIMAMGFPREDVHQAMRLSYNNPDRAVEYLISGEDGGFVVDEGMEPYENEEYDDENDSRADDAYYEVPLDEGMAADDTLFDEAEESEDAERIIHALIEGNMPQEAAPEQGIAEEPVPQQPPATQPPAGPQSQPPAAQPPPQAPQNPVSGGADPFRDLITQPQFQQMRQVLQQNPHLLAQLMEQLYRTNPELFQVIRNNQERFLAYLNEESGESGGIPELGGQPPVAMPEAQDPFSGAGGAGNTIRMTPDEREAIERLKALGFPEMMVIQAYFACDKNEDAAANFLLSEAFGDDD